MFSRTRELKWMVVSAGLTFVLVLGFQNCAPSLPDNDVRQLGGASVRPTPLPSATPPPAIGDTVYGGLVWEGTCTNDFGVENMAVPGLDQPYLPLALFTRASDGAGALWNYATDFVHRGVVCKLNSAGWKLAGQGDFNGDAQQDVIWRNTDGKVAVWLMNGSTRVSGGMLSDMTAAWYLEGTRDFDGDGKADLVWRNLSTHQMRFWFMDGASVKSTSAPIFNGVASLVEDKFHILGVGDFDGDFKGDILFRDDTNLLSIWFMNGATIREVKNPSPVSNPAYTFLGVGDFDGDYKADIFWKNPANGQGIIWKMNKEVRSAEQLLATIDATWTFVQSVDANGDGKMDWIWSTPNAATGLPGFTISYNLTFSQNPPTTTVYNPIRSGWVPFTYPHY